MSKHILEGRRAKILQSISASGERSYAHGIIVSMSGVQGLLLADDNVVHPINRELILEDPDALRRELLGEPAPKTDPRRIRVREATDGEGAPCWSWSVEQPGWTPLAGGYKYTEDDAWEKAKLFLHQHPVEGVASPAPKRSLHVVEGRRHGALENCWAWSVREANGDIVTHGFGATEDEATQAGLLWCILSGVPVVAPENSGRAQVVALGRQPAPLPSTGDVWQEVIDSIAEGHPLRALCEARRLLGLERYGTLLQRGNGRDMTLDLQEELLDAMAYARGADLRWLEGRIADILEDLIRVGGKTPSRPRRARPTESQPS